MISVYRLRLSSDATPDDDGICRKVGQICGSGLPGSSSGEDCVHLIMTDGISTFHERYNFTADIAFYYRVLDRLTLTPSVR